MSKARYRWAKGAPFSIDAQKAGERLEFIRRRNDGALNARLVVDDAKLKTSPLHKAFVWDDAKAAEAFRLQQARSLLNHIEVVVVISKRKPAQPVRAFLNVRQDGHTGYQPAAEVLSDTALRKQVLDRAWDEIVDWKERYERLKEFAEIVRVIEREQRKGKQNAA